VRAGSAYVLILGMTVASALQAQTPDGLLAAGRARVAARDLDSARTLLASAAESTRGGAPQLRAEALMLLGLVHYYQGADSLAGAAFARALRLRPEARLPLVQESDPDVTRLLERERCRLSALDATFVGVCVVTGLTALPQIDAMPALLYPPDLRNRGVEGRVWIAVVIDTLGDPVPGSVSVAESPDSGFNAVALAAVAGAHFLPGAVDGKLVRTRLQVPIDFHIGGAPRDSALPALPVETAVDCLPDCPAGVTKPVLRSLLDLRSGPLSVGPSGKIDGTVTVDALVRSDGRVDPEASRMTAQGVPVETGTTVFDAVRRALFEPARRDGQAVAARVRVRIEFVTPPSGAPRVDIRVL
jgi:TonB family protein